MEHIVDPVAEQRGGRLESMAQLGMCAGRTVAHGNDVNLAYEDRGLAVGDLVVPRCAVRVTTNNWSPKTSTLGN